jgi:2',3'-cyclic-nucleotide 2'-phosphodiesterase (5'-nucleotidase family)
MKFKIIFVPFIPVLITACASLSRVASDTGFNTSVNTLYKVGSNYRSDSNILNFLKPYSTEVDRQMNVVIGETETALEKKSPKGTLGIFVSEAMRLRASISYRKSVDVAFINTGGLRVEDIPAGPITLGKVYELMPFDNVIVLLQLNGDKLLKLIDIVSTKKAGVFAGLVDGKAIVNQTIYTVATTDYTAKGNEGFEMLQNINQENNGYLLRDALVDYIKEATKQGKIIRVLQSN